VVDSTKKAIAPALIHEEGNLLRRVVRDVYTKDMKEVYVEGIEAYKETKKYMSQVLPSCSKFVKQYKNKTPIFTKYNVEKEILKRSIKLKIPSKICKEIIDNNNEINQLKKAIHDLENLSTKN